MEINLFSLLYLFFRLLPISIALLMSLNQFFWRGATYSIGLLLSLLINYQILGQSSATPKSQCNMFNVAGMYGANTPHSLVILIHTFTYLLYYYYDAEKMSQNLHVIILFAIMTVADSFWNYKYQCVTAKSLGLCFLVSFIFGIYWARTILKSNLPNLQLQNENGCKRVSSTIFRCGNTSMQDKEESQEEITEVQYIHEDPGHHHRDDQIGQYESEFSALKDKIANFLPINNDGFQFKCIYDCDGYVRRNSIGYVRDHCTGKYNRDGIEITPNLSSEIYKHWLDIGITQEYDASSYSCGTDEKFVKKLKEEFDKRNPTEGFTPNIFSDNTKYSVEPRNIPVAPDLFLANAKRQLPISKQRSKFNFTTKDVPKKQSLQFQDAIMSSSETIQKNYPNMNRQQVQEILDYLQGKKEVINTMNEDQIEIARITADYLETLGFNVYDK